MVITFSGFAQETAKMTTKMDAFTSKTGIISKFTDFKMNNLKASYINIKTRITKIQSGDVTLYFYQIEKLEKSGNSIASIEYTDLLETLKAINILKAEIDQDIASNPDYLENKFVTDDGFKLGYYVSKGKAKWYIKLDKSGKNNTIFVNDVSKIEIALTEAKTKIEELKGNS